MSVVDLKKERDLVLFGRKTGKTDEEIKKAILTFREQNKESTFVERAGTALKKRTDEFKKTLTKTKENPEMLAFETPVRLLGDVAGGITDIASSAVEPILKPVLEKIGETDIGGQAFKALSEGMNGWNNWKGQSQANERIGKLIESVVNIADVVGVSKGASILKTESEKIAQTGIQTIKDTVETSIEKVASQPSIKSGVGVVTEGAKDVGKFIQRIPDRLATSSLEKQRQNIILKSFEPDQQNAIRDGILVRDVSLIDSANPDELSLMQEMLGRAKRFEVDRKTEEPSAVLGGLVQKRVSDLEGIRTIRGKKMGEIAKQIKTGEVLEDEVQSSVIARLNSTPGLNGISVDERGILDFSDTVLSGALTKADRNIIQKAFLDVRGRNPYQLHTLRQELFEVLGGKKRANVQLTDTQENALEAIREGLADVLEGVNKEYKSASRSYREVMEPLKKLRKFYQGLEGADRDILDERAALLARRLTSNAVSAPEIRKLFSDIDGILITEGKKTPVSLDRMQDFLNALDRYFDIARDTSLAGQIKTSSKGVVDFVTEKLGGAIMVTPEIKKKAFEKLLRQNLY